MINAYQQQQQHLQQQDQQEEQCLQGQPLMIQKQDLNSTSSESHSRAPFSYESFHGGSTGSVGGGSGTAGGGADGGLGTGTGAACGGDSTGSEYEDNMFDEPSCLLQASTTPSMIIGQQAQSVTVTMAPATTGANFSMSRSCASDKWMD